MVVEGSRQETLDLGFMLLGIRQQGVPVLLREPMFLDGFDHVPPSYPCSLKYSVLDDKKIGGISGENLSLSNLKTVFKSPPIRRYVTIGISLS
ncbi:unnamed protein product [Schistosoma mattheei]|uniref:Uncharacterized protein n=1 Tax=Schistosoma mattheei TaxID=31246 RepID=A0A183PSY7_9TREM|nr:unnamed protein product [Schistosoma mattheei]